MADEEQYPPTVETEETTKEPTSKEDLTQAIPGFRLLQRLGEGGMGEVFEAEQFEPVRRRVALKLIKRGMESKEVLARFDSERQALALMSHPNIAQVFDAGTTTDGRPYFVMEFVQGVPVTRYCDSNRLTTNERLELFTQICDGVQHAHHKGVIHRDIKPSNVLVKIQNSKPIPKIIDFGVAKAISQRLTEQTLFTAIGEFIGTPEYMSPEQAEMTELDIDTRTDVYSLGVVLYEMLVGAQPFDGRELRRVGFDEMRRKIREEEPPRPSVRLSGLGEQSTTAAANRRMEPSTLARQLHGDLDWITMKALEKDRTRRYDSPSELAADIGRHLRDEPVLAGPPSATYRVKKFVRRHTVGVAAGALVVLALVLGIAGTSVGMIRARVAERAVAREAETARQISEFLVDLFAVSDPGEAQGNTVTARELLDKGAARIEQELVDQPLVRARLLNTIGTVYQKLGLFNEAEELLEGALKLRREHLDSTHPDLAVTLRALADTYDSNGSYDQSQTHYEQALAIQEQSLGPEHPEVAITLRCLSNAHTNKAEYDEALALLQRALAIHVKTIGRDHPEFAVTFNNYANIHLYKGDYDQAVVAYEEALAIQEASLGTDHPDLAVTLNNLAIAHAQKGALDRAQVYFERVVRINEKSLGPDHPDLASNLTNLAAVHFYQGDYDQAALFHRRALAIQEKSLGPSHPNLADTLGNLAGVHKENGEYREAEALYERALAIREEALGPNHPGVAGALSNLSAVLIDKGDYGRALTLLQRALAIQEESLGPQHHGLAAVLANVAVVYKDSGVYDQARASFERALAISEQSIGPDHPDVASLLNSLALIHNEEREYEHAEALHRRALNIAEKAFEGSNHPVLAHLLCDHALTCFELGKYEEAETGFRRSLRILESHRSEGRDSSGDRREEARTLYGLGRVHQALGRTQQAYDAWSRVAEILGPIAGTADNESLSIYGRTLLHLGRAEEARPVNERLLSSGFRNRAFLDVLREHGVGEAQPGG